MNGASVVAVVVTYKRADVLQTCLEALQAQTLLPSAVVVVDNGSSQNAEDQETTAVLTAAAVRGKRPSVYVERPLVNIGPGGGFSRGMARALALEPQWLWVMDDDVEPERECLEELVRLAETHKSSNETSAIFWPTVLGPQGEQNTDPGWSGFLLNAYVVKCYGLPREDYVWWSEDTEFLQYRLRDKGGLSNLRSQTARVSHWHAPRGGVTPDWKLYYEGRNATHLRLHLKRYNYWRLFRLWTYVAKQAVSPPTGGSRLRRVDLALRGILHGIQGKLGRRVEPGTGKWLESNEW